MQFFKVVLSALGFVALTQAASLAIQNKDRNDYVMCFIPNDDKFSQVHDSVFVPASQRVVISMQNS